MKSHSPKSARGFTLVEVTIALLVLGIGIGSSMIALRIGFAAVEVARDKTIVSQFMQSEMETLRLKNWEEISALPAESLFAIESEFDDFNSDRFRSVRRIRNVRPNVAIREVTLEVTWTSTNGVARQAVYQTRIARHGINDYFYVSHLPAEN